ncbi:MAG: ribonuclease P protein component, partial [Rhodospirillales bacterium]|nr:ribonuclease P protein component [Rhodospirillales bacterium]
VTRGLILQERVRLLHSEPAGDYSPIRIGFTVSRKVGNAVARNRARRRLRAVAEIVFPAHAKGGRDYVIIGRGETVLRPFAALVTDMEKALQRLDAFIEDGVDEAETAPLKEGT